MEIKRLIGAILLKAIEAWNDPDHQAEIEEFLNSEWFDELVWALGLDPAIVRNQLKTGTFKHISTRAAYR